MDGDTPVDGAGRPAGPLGGPGGSADQQPQPQLRAFRGAQCPLRVTASLGDPPHVAGHALALGVRQALALMGSGQVFVQEV
jgi:hypothetical protein